MTKHLTEAPHEVEGTAESNWEVLKSCILKAEEIVGRERKNQPDWFLENAESLKPLTESENRAHNQMLCLIPTRQPALLRCHLMLSIVNLVNTVIEAPSLDLEAFLTSSSKHSLLVIKKTGWVNLFQAVVVQFFVVIHRRFDRTE